MQHDKKVHRLHQGWLMQGGQPRYLKVHQFPYTLVQLKLVPRYLYSWPRDKSSLTKQACETPLSSSSYFCLCLKMLWLRERWDSKGLLYSLDSSKELIHMFRLGRVYIYLKPSDSQVRLRGLQGNLTRLTRSYGHS